MPPPNISPSIPAAGALGSPLSVPHQQRAPKTHPGQVQHWGAHKTSKKNTIPKGKEHQVRGLYLAPHPPCSPGEFLARAPRLWQPHASSRRGTARAQRDTTSPAQPGEGISCFPASGILRNEQRGPGLLPTCSQAAQGAAGSPAIPQSCTTSILGRRLPHAAGCAR